MKQQVAILVSGSGTNMLRLIQAFQGSQEVEIALVICNRPGAGAIQRAEAEGIPVRVIPHQEYPSRSAFDQAMAEVLQEASVDWICLAGFMRVLTESFVNRFANQILNVHPSLLPAFPGLDAIGQALDYGVAVTGCTVHLVTPEMDAGPIIMQAVVPVYDTDSNETLAKRIQAEEHRIYPEALARVVSRGWKIEGRRFCEHEGSQSA